MLWKKSIWASEKGRGTNTFWYRLPEHCSQGLGNVWVTSGFLTSLGYLSHWGRRRGAFWPSPLNHTQRSESFIIVTIISISLTHKSCDKSTDIIFCDKHVWSMYGGSSATVILNSLAGGFSKLKCFMNQKHNNPTTGTQCIKVQQPDFQSHINSHLPSELLLYLLHVLIGNANPSACCDGTLSVQNKGPPTLCWKSISVSYRGMLQKSRSWQGYIFFFIILGASHVCCAKWREALH